MKSGEANVTIEVRLNEGGKTGEIVIRGMSEYYKIELNGRYGYRYDQGRTCKESGYDSPFGDQ